MTELNIISQIGACHEFMASRKATREEISIVISPIRVTENQGEIKVINGCNMWQSCKNERCHFSAGGRSLPKVKGLG
jgi:hypothetical protein